MILPEIFRIIWHRQEAAKIEYNAGKQLLVSLEKDEVASVEYWLYWRAVMNSVPIRYRIKILKSSWLLPAWTQTRQIKNRKGERG